ncbi:Putative lipoate-protein ligase A [Cytospora mali]|uniref:Putative lipoate-protein ligase A n=1 Tax=Cytospora mali TaxID=578113 RepID=A0A194VT97_CYTMA|nr:Putative lipoate-protein ligase A [Valsa mali]
MTWRVNLLQKTCWTPCIQDSPQQQQHHHHHHHNNKKCISSAASTSWHAQASHQSSRVQIYTSRSRDPYLNLSAEHFLLQNSHPDSTILFLYTNDPCVVIGRNQNPWLEVNLHLLGRFRAKAGGNGNDNGNGDDTRSVSLVRRRSGGGAVFHDGGNVNYSVICPPAVFDRNKHAEMVVRALRGLGVGTARVNERHDIVVDAGDGSASKISGSAYKLTRLRSLHHGTCLLDSPNMADIGRLLRSPAEPYVKARGVESVRSRIRNVGLSSEEFVEAVKEEFGVMYGDPDVEVSMGEGKDAPDFAHEQIQKGYRELTSHDWIYNQTPQFTFSTHPTEDDPRERPPLPTSVPEDFRAIITARHGQIQEADLTGLDGGALQGQNLNAITDWRQVLESDNSATLDSVGRWFNDLFGTNVK